MKLSPRAWLLGTICDACLLSLVSVYLNETLIEDRIAIAGDFIGLTKTYNSGIAFGMSLGPLQNWIIPLVLLGVLAYAWTHVKRIYEAIGFGLIVGGGLANVLDRTHDGLVTDMIQMGSFPVFNVADTLINVGVGVLVFFAIRQTSSIRISE